MIYVCLIYSILQPLYRFVFLSHSHVQLLHLSFKLWGLIITRLLNFPEINLTTQFNGMFSQSTQSQTLLHVYFKLYFQFFDLSRLNLLLKIKYLIVFSEQSIFKILNLAF